MNEQPRLRWQITMKENGLLLRDFLVVEQQISKKSLARIKHGDGCILINGTEKTVRYVVQTGDMVELILPTETPSSSITPENIKLDIRYEDEHYLVLNKPANMNTIPSRQQSTGSLANAVLFYYEQKKIAATFHAVNRLDRDTSGLLIVAKHQLAHDKLSKLQQEHKVHRIYEAIVEGKVTPLNCMINIPIRRKKTSIIQREAHSSEGQHAVTHYRVIKQNEQYSHVEIKLETGRTHQIRVHFSFLHYPLCGDDLYGGSLRWITRQALHCKEVRFWHPFIKEEIKVQASWPDDLQNLYELVGL
ncbi:RluA family pseudouridine synthase [Alkalihalobacillus trypoxylicola]